MRLIFFARALCVHSYMKFQEFNHNPVAHLFWPPQVVTCSSASAAGDTWMAIFGCMQFVKLHGESLAGSGDNYSY